MYINKLNKYKSKLEDLVGGKRERADILKQNEKKFIGQGSYSCITAPPIKCLGDPIKPKQPDENGLTPEQIAQARQQYMTELKAYSGLYKEQISKLMDPIPAKREFDETRILVGLDPDKRYFIWPNKICDVDPQYLRKPDGSYLSSLQMCKTQFEQVDANKKLLYIDYSGKPIYKVNILNTSEIPLIFNSVINLLEGINVLHANNLVHLDIKISNILTLKKGGIITSKFIDFGLMIYIPNFFERITDQYPDLNTNYNIWPIELKYLSLHFLNGTNHSRITKLTKMHLKDKNVELQQTFNQWFSLGISSVLTLYEDDVTDIGSGFRRVTPLSSLYIYDDTRLALIDNAKNAIVSPEIMAWKQTLPIDKSLTYITSDHVKAALSPIRLAPGSPEFILHSIILKGVDIYSIGIVLAQIYAKYVGQVLSTQPYDDGKIYKLLNYKFQRIILPPLLIPYLDRLNDELTTPFTYLCKRFMEFNYTKRIKAPEALAEYTAFLPRFAILSDPQFEELCNYRGMFA